MSHRVKGKTCLTIADEDIVKESLEEAFPEHTIVEDSRYMGTDCKFVVNGHHGRAVCGLEENKDGELSLITYNAAGSYSRDQGMVDEKMSKVYTTFAGKKIVKELKARGIECEVSPAEDSELEIDGKVKPTKKVSVTITGGISTKTSRTVGMDGDSGSMDGGM